MQWELICRLYRGETESNNDLQLGRQIDDCLVWTVFCTSFLLHRLQQSSHPLHCISPHDHTPLAPPPPPDHAPPASPPPRPSQDQSERKEGRGRRLAVAGICPPPDRRRKSSPPPPEELKSLELR
jgi:hypothetical protein